MKCVHCDHEINGGTTVDHFPSCPLGADDVIGEGEHVARLVSTSIEPGRVVQVLEVDSVNIEHVSYRDDVIDFSKPSIAVIASDGAGHGCVLWYAEHSAIDSMIEGVGAELEALGLDDAPAGITIWEGNMRGGERRSTPDGEDYSDTYLVGNFRALTSYEWGAMMENVAPWDLRKGIAESTREELMRRVELLEGAYTAMCGNVHRAVEEREATRRALVKRDDELARIIRERSGA